MTKGGLTINPGVSALGKYTCNLDAVLEQQGRMKKWLCAVTKIDPSWMTKLAAGDSIPNVHHAIRIARALGVTVEELWPLEE